MKKKTGKRRPQEEEQMNQPAYRPASEPAAGPAFEPAPRPASGSRKAVLIIAIVTVVLLAALAVLLILMARNKKDAKGYFLDEDYPVSVTPQKNGELLIELDGQKTPDYKWSINNESEDVADVTVRKAGKNGKLSSLVTPLAEGYANVFYERKGEVGGYEYTAAEIYAEILVTQDEEGNLTASLSDIRETAGTDAGAVDSESPYILEGSRIVFPKGLDWELLDEETGESIIKLIDDTEDDGLDGGSVADEVYDDSAFEEEEVSELYRFHVGITEDEISFIEAGITSLLFRPGADGELPDISEISFEKKLILKNEELGITEKITCQLDDEGGCMFVKGQD